MTPTSRAQCRSYPIGSGLVLALLLMLGAVAACGFRPMYGDKSPSSVSSMELAAVQIDLVRDREGQMLRNELLDRFQPAGAAPKALYGLTIGLATQKIALGINPDGTSSRANLIMTANYTVRDLDNGDLLFRGYGRSTTGFNVLDSDFATTTSEDDATRRAVFDLSEQIATRVSIVLGERKTAAAKSSTP